MSSGLSMVAARLQRVCCRLFGVIGPISGCVCIGCHCPIIASLLQVVNRFQLMQVDCQDVFSTSLI